MTQLHGISYIHRVNRIYSCLMSKQVVHIVTYKPIARQRFGKHIPAGAKARNNRTYIVRQRISKQA
jgi:hypothetical protein